MSHKNNETYYDLLKVDQKATVSEIVAAYHAAKGAFSKDSLATYSLFNAEETQSMLGQLEEAYLTLSNIEKKREYDKRLSQNQGGVLPFPPTPLHPEKTTKPLVTIVPENPAQEPIQEDFTAPEEAPITGAYLKEIRIRKSLTIEDVARVTKIPARFIKAIEENQKENLPTRVYLQGFVKNLASLYRLDPQNTVKTYLEILDLESQNG
jgi:curved DNA-binding protein CbpA